MYQRSILHILAPLGLVLLLFLVYQVILKPRFLPAPATAPVVNSVVVEPVEAPPLPSNADARRDEIPAARAIDQSVVPESRQASLLEAIRTDIESDHLKAAETKLAMLSPDLLADGRNAGYAAILWNNLGLRQEHQDGPAAALQSFKRAGTLDPRNPVINLNLAHAYWALRDPALNADFLTDLIALAPREPFPHLAMADLLYAQDNLAEAGTHLAQATERIGQDPALQSYLAMVTARVRRADSAEANMLARSSTHFTVKFDGTEDPHTWTTVLDILEDAYRDIGQRFGHFPSKPVVVVLHTRERFQGATGSPAWADGLFDPALGRIQIPTLGAVTDKAQLTNVLRHEYVHALLHDRLGPGSGALPLWLNEGLAMQWAGNDWPDLNQTMPGEVNIIPLQYLEGSWGQLPPTAVALAYREANSVTRFLIDRFGMPRINDLLAAFHARESVATALRTKLFLSYDQFQQQWLDTIQQKRM